MKSKALFLSMTAACASVFASMPAQAQTISTQIFDSSIPFSYNRGRNISVLDRPRPEYDPLGIPVGPFTVQPALDLSTGYDDNVYQTTSNKISDGFVTVNPSVRAASNWSANSLVLQATGGFTRFMKETPRNQNSWSVSGNGRVDLDTDNSVSLLVRTAQDYDTPFAGTAVINTLSPIPVRSTYVQGSSDSKMGRFRLELLGDYSAIDYKSVTTLSGDLLNQDERDRKIARVAAHIEYGLTPDTGVFIRAMVTRTNYDTLLATGAPNRDSREIRILAGASSDISAVLRGTLGVGYVKREYDAALYNDLSGLSLDAKLEYFLSQLTTITVAARRQIEDSVVTGSSGYWNNGVVFRIDHELLRNLLLNVGADYEADDFRGIAGKATVFRTSGGADYLINNLFRLNFGVGYSRRTSDNALNGPRLDEFRASVGVRIRR